MLGAMGIFGKDKAKYAFSDILKGLQYAINSAQEMLQAQKNSAFST